MAIDINQDYGFGHTMLYRAWGGTTITFPRTFACWIKVSGTWIASDKFVVAVSRNTGSANAALQLTDATDHPNGPDATFRAEIQTLAGFGGESTKSPILPLYEWVHIAAVFEGIGTTTPTFLTCYGNGVVGTTVAGGTDIPYTDINWLGYGGLRPTQTTTQALTNCCVARMGHWNTALSAEQIALLAAGTLPNDHATLGTTADQLVDYLESTNEATAGDNLGDSGIDFTVNEVVDHGDITTCIDSPVAVEPPETGEVEECAEDFADELQTAITWPKCDLIPASINVEVVSPTVSPGRSFTGAETVVKPDAGFWRIVLTGIPIRSKADALLWREIESGLNGRNNPILVPVYEGKLSATPIAATVVGDAVIGQTLLVLEQTAGSTIVSGMQFSFGERLYRVARIVDSSGSFLTIRVFPPLREAVSDDAACEFNDPYCRCRLEQDDGMDVNLELLRFAQPSVSFVEDV